MTLLPYSGDLESSIPAEVRLEVYKKALHYVEETKDHMKDFNLSVPALCLLLPCILWELTDYLNNYEGKSWRFLDTATAFPEIKEGVAELMKLENTSGYRSEGMRELRRKTINEAIKALE